MSDSLTEDAKIIAGTVLYLMLPEKGELIFKCEVSRPTPRMRAALDDLEAAGYVRAAHYGAKTLRWVVTKSCREFAGKYDRRAAEGFITNEPVS